MTIAEARDLLATARPCRDLMDPVVYDRALRAANHEEPDRVPIWDYIDSWDLFQELAPGLEDPVQATATVYNTLEIDFARSINAPRSLAHEGEEWGEGVPNRKTSGRTIWVTRHPINNLDELQRYVAALPAPPTPEACLPTVATIAGYRDLFAPQTFYVPGYGVGFHAAYGTMTMDLFALMLYDAPDEIRALIEHLNAGAVAHCRAYADANLSPFFFIGDDIAYKHKLMFSPAMLQELFFPYLTRMCEVLNAAGIKVIFHSDGDITSILPDLIECGVAGINPVETMAGMDIAYVKREYGQDLILVGGVDCSQVIPLGTPERIRQEVRQVLHDGGRGGGMFIGSSSEIVPATPLRNIHAFYDACKELGRYPLAF
jgi:uroporphyrinogen decarboxylase